jgi:DNA polymerase V
MTAHEMTMTMVRDVLYNTGITATAGIGTNLFLAKVAMDIVAKKAKPDKDGVRIAELDEMSFREILWTHRPLTDFWRIGGGTAARLEALQLFTLGDVARASLDPIFEAILYKTFGINAELIIDHAWGWEPVTVDVIKQYRPSMNSISSGQVLHCPYDFEKGRLIVREMTELMVLDLVRKRLVTKQIVLNIGYDRESLTGDSGKDYTGPVAMDHYGRKIPKHAHGTGNIDHYTSSTHAIMETVLDLYDRIVNKKLLIRRVNIAACNLISEDDIPEDKPLQLDMFTDYEQLERDTKVRRAAEEKERKLQRVTLTIQDRFGKNAMLKGMNLMEGGTTIDRNGQIGGHKAGEQ